jgi:hypothetical protein
MVVAFWANLQVPFDDLSINDFITRIAFNPKVFGESELLPIPLFFLFFFFFLLKPGHLFGPFLSMELALLEGLWPPLRVAKTSDGRTHTGL